MDVVSTEVMKAGERAKSEGHPMSVNPYRAGSQDSADWLQGYTFDEAEQNVNHPEDEG